MYIKIDLIEKDQLDNKDTKKYFVKLWSYTDIMCDEPLNRFVVYDGSLKNYQHYISCDSDYLDTILNFIKVQAEDAYDLDKKIREKQDIKIKVEKELTDIGDMLKKLVESKTDLLKLDVLEKLKIKIGDIE